MNNLRYVGRSSIAPPRRGETVPATVERPRRDAARRRGVRIGLWLPLTPLVLLLSPVALLAAPLADLTPAGRRVRPIRSVWALCGLLLSLSGTSISIDSARARVRIRIF